MTWNYVVAQIATNRLMQVRRLIGDVIATDQQIADEEIIFSLTQKPSVYGAAAECCKYIAAQYSRKVDIVTAGAGGQLKQNYSAQAKAYLEMGARLDNMAASRSGAMPFAGGIFNADKVATEQDSSLVSPQFVLGMTDNFIPVGPVGNETPGNPATTGTAP